ncbi:uncharacterized protein LOC111626155 [Centruroides sculpturatus]|uniref:uncharacterized protein LOC111626155 n=1 Tax=Centruroides sculpturatus TaxID=218467 RepID=UPI000C6DDEF3|nr:uncharacterized protein LOC111626155 [Centruroides sculpturatus]
MDIGKILTMILKERLSGLMEEQLADEQAGFRKDRKSEEQLEKTLHLLNEERKRYGLIINSEKTKTIFGDNNMSRNILNGKEIENVESFTYLGRKLTYNLDCKNKIAIRIAKAKTTLKAMDKIWKSKAISLQTKLKVLNTCIFSCMLYACETWVMTKDMESKILEFEEDCYRKILQIGWMQKVTNEELYNRIYMKKNLLQKIIQ